jgi:hypothetical protein
MRLWILIGAKEMMFNKITFAVFVLCSLPTLAVAGPYENQWHLHDWVGGLNTHDPMIPLKIDGLTDKNQLHLTQAFVTCDGPMRVVNGVLAGAAADVEFTRPNTNANTAMWPILMVHAGTTFGADGTALNYHYLGEVKGSYRITKETLVRIFAGGNRVGIAEPDLVCQFTLFGEFEPLKSSTRKR